jgi:Uma2 family endonuclease
LKRQEFKERLQRKQPHQIVYVDEAGIDNREDFLKKADRSIRLPSCDTIRVSSSLQLLPNSQRLHRMVNPTITIPKTFKVSHEQFQQLAAVNRDLRLERTASGELIVIPPTGSDIGSRNLDIEGQLWLWNRQTKLGKAFNSSTGFHLPNGADRSPDAAWVKLERWEALTPEERQGFAPICPDFVLELRSPSDNLEPLRAKMKEYMENKARLGWLIDQKNAKVEIYRQGRNVEILDHPITLSGEDVLPEFVLDLTEVWQ